MEDSGLDVRSALVLDAGYPPICFHGVSAQTEPNLAMQQDPLSYMQHLQWHWSQPSVCSLRGKRKYCANCRSSDGRVNIEKALETLQLIPDAFEIGTWDDDWGDIYKTPQLTPMCFRDLGLSGVNYFSLSTTIIIPYWRQLQSWQSNPLPLHWSRPEQRIRLCRDAT